MRSIHSIRHPRSCLAGLCLLISSSGGIPNATASCGHSFSLAERVHRAEAIVEGVVVGIDHRNADPLEPGGVRFPHTFVTFAIQHVFKGQVEGDALTLRFLGGPNGEGLTLHVSGIPSFSPGDHGVLFVAGNGEHECPLVGDEQGCLRVVRGELVDDSGHELWTTAGGDVITGARTVDLSLPGAPPVATEEPQALDPHAGFEPPPGARRADAAGFRTVLRKVVEHAPETALAAPVRSARADRPFVFGLVAAPPPPFPAPPADPRGAPQEGDVPSDRGR